MEQMKDERDFPTIQQLQAELDKRVADAAKYE